VVEVGSQPAAIRVQGVLSAPSVCGKLTLSGTQTGPRQLELQFTRHPLGPDSVCFGVAGHYEVMGQVHGIAAGEYAVLVRYTLQRPDGSAQIDALLVDTSVWVR